MTDRVVLRFLAAPGDTTTKSGLVSAGRLLEWIDKAAYACAVGWSRGYSVTAYVGNVRFQRSVAPGELVEVHARIVQTGTTSMHILISVHAKHPSEPEYHEVMHCLSVMVAVDPAGHPTSVPQWEPQNLVELDLPELIAERVTLRREIQAKMLAAPYTDAGTAPRSKLRFLATPADVNFGGKVHGGTLMRWIDEAGFSCAASWSSGDAVAIYAGGIQFAAPIRIGDIVEVEARLIYTTPRSMHVAITASSAPIERPTELTRNARCMAIYVVPGGGRATPVRQWEPVSEEDRILVAHAKELIALRAKMPPLPASVSRI